MRFLVFLSGQLVAWLPLVLQLTGVISKEAKYAMYAGIFAGAGVCFLIVLEEAITAEARSKRHKK